MTEDELNDFMDEVYAGDVQSVAVGSESITGDPAPAPEVNEQIEVTNSIGAGIIFVLGVLGGILLSLLFFKRWS